MPTAYAITMTPIDWGISIAALMMLLFSARMLVSGKGKSQMGLSFAVMAAVVWTFAIGRHIPGFTTVDGVRVAAGALLLVPVLRSFFSQTGASITGAVVSVLLATAIAGPVVARYSPNVIQEEAPMDEQLRTKLTAVDSQLADLNATKETIAGFAAIERTKLADFKLETESELDKNPEAMAALSRWADYKGEMNSLSVRIADLRAQKQELESYLSAIERGTGSVSAIEEAKRIREAVERNAGAEDKTIIEEWNQREKMMELFKKEFGSEAVRQAD